MENEILRFSKAPNLNSDYQKTEKERMNPGHGTRNEKKETPKSNTTHTEGDLTSVSALKENTERDREPELDNNGTISTDIGMDPADSSLADDEPWEHEFYEFYVGESGL